MFILLHICWIRYCYCFGSCFVVNWWIQARNWNLAPYARSVHHPAHGPCMHETNTGTSHDRAQHIRPLLQCTVRSLSHGPCMTLQCPVHALVHGPCMTFPEITKRDGKICWLRLEANFRKKII